MSRLLQFFSLLLPAISAFAIDSEPPKTNATTWEIYALVVLVFVAGFAWVYIVQKKEKEREQDKPRDASSGRS
jgi:uncharacterized BrkB/YihY/UPF0761 family membrane protein